VNLFLDSSVLLAASGSASGASRALFLLARNNEWVLLTSSYVLVEVERNLPLLPLEAASDWRRLRTLLRIVPDILSPDRPVVFEASKDRPILFTALAWADVLLTLDRGDFEPLIGKRFYGLEVAAPAAFLTGQRASGRLIVRAD
jgi:predicted nucleic acid-binding protein